jgi:hypothetical protein
MGTVKKGDRLIYVILTHIIYRALHDRLRGKISNELILGAVWLAAEDAAKALATGDHPLSIPEADWVKGMKNRWFGYEEADGDP